MSIPEFKLVYEVQASDLAGHYFQVRLHIIQGDDSELQLYLPAWIPGSYMIRDFARNIIGLKAVHDGQALLMQQLDKQSWRISQPQYPLTLEYRVYAWDLSVRSAHLDQLHGYFNGTSVFLAVKGMEQQPCRVDLLPPEDPVASTWRVATAMPRLQAEPYNFGSYQAPNYDELIDHPVEMGEFHLLSFEAAGVKHDIAITGGAHGDLERLSKDVQRICEYQLNFFGDPKPMDYYLFQLMVTDNGYGGLEHRASTSLVCKRRDLPEFGMEEPAADYRSLLGLFSHEYFHTWNVKRIKPARFERFDYSQENYTELLWVFEGFTSYYDDLILRRSGVISQASYLQALAETISRVMRFPGRLQQSIAQSSFNTWTKFYKQDENAPNAISSYYTKGSLVALALDLSVRQQSANQHSLDDVMKHLWRRYNDTGRGLQENELQALIQELCGVDVSDLLAECVHGVKDPDLQTLFKAFAVELQWRAPCGPDDKGGKASGKAMAVELGAMTAEDSAGIKLTHVVNGGSAHQAGLSAGDILVAVDGLRVSKGGLPWLLKQVQAGQQSAIIAFRRDHVLQMTLCWQAPAVQLAQLNVSGEKNVLDEGGWILSA